MQEILLKCPSHALYMPFKCPSSQLPVLFWFGHCPVFVQSLLGYDPIPVHAYSVCVERNSQRKGEQNKEGKGRNSQHSSDPGYV